MIYRLAVPADCALEEFYAATVPLFELRPYMRNCEAVNDQFPHPPPLTTVAVGRCPCQNHFLYATCTLCG